MYQSCPICLGTGVDQTSAFTSNNMDCPVCEGARIVDENTGLPPKIVNENISYKCVHNGNCTIQTEGRGCDFCIANN